MAALGTSIVITALMIGITIVYGRRRAIGTPVTWGEAMLGATWVFMIFVLVFGVVPDRWVRLTDNEWGWSVETFVFTEGQFIDDPITFPPFRMDKKKLSDVVVVIEHLVALGALPFAWLWWQKRGQGVAVEAPVSDFGRPLVKGN